MKAIFFDYGTVSGSGDLDTRALDRVFPGMVYFQQSSDAQVTERIVDAECALVNKAVLSGAILEAAVHLKLILLAATGTDNVDLKTAAERGIAVCNVHNYCTSSVAQHVWGVTLMLTHHLREHARLAVDGAWARNASFTLPALPIRELNGKTLGIVGLGELGRAVATIGNAFGMNVIVAQRKNSSADPTRVELSQLLRQADVVSLHCPLNIETRGMIGAAELALMKPDAILVNTARGALVDGAALADALRRGRLGGAAIDVLPQEPPRDGHPLLDATIPNLIVTPHIAWAAREARQRCIDEMAANAHDFLSGGRRGRIV